MQNLRTLNHGNAYLAQDVKINNYCTIKWHFYNETCILWLIRYTYFMVYILGTTLENVTLFGCLSLVIVKFMLRIYSWEITAFNDVTCH